MHYKTAFTKKEHEQMITAEMTKELFETLTDEFINNKKKLFVGKVKKGVSPDYFAEVTKIYQQDSKIGHVTVFEEVLLEWEQIVVKDGETIKYLLI